MEIERKFLIDTLPFNPEVYPSTEIVQAYLNVAPVVRIRRDGDDYYLTYKSGGLMAREEYNLPLNKSAFYHLLSKADGNIISKTRYRIPLGEKYTIELDFFHDKFEGVRLAEIEFETVEEAEAFNPPDYFGKDVTYDPEYHNSNMSRKVFD